MSGRPSQASLARAQGVWRKVWRCSGGKLSLSREEVVDNAYIFLLAGFETTSTALTFTSWALAKHPDVQV